MSGGSSSNGYAAAADGPAGKLQVQGAAAGNSGDGSANSKRRTTGDHSAGAPIGSTSRGNSGSGSNVSWQAAAAAAVPRDTAGPMGPELQEAVDQVRLHGLHISTRYFNELVVAWAHLKLIASVCTT
jgi:hypothetical protein